MFRRPYWRDPLLALAVVATGVVVARVLPRAHLQWGASFNPDTALDFLTALLLWWTLGLCVVFTLGVLRRWAAEPLSVPDGARAGRTGDRSGQAVPAGAVSALRDAASSGTDGTAHDWAGSPAPGVGDDAEAPEGRPRLASTAGSGTRRVEPPHHLSPTGGEPGWTTSRCIDCQAAVERGRPR